jgi:arylamine N-acetyltransferase
MRTTTGSTLIGGYLARIRVDGAPQPTLDALRQLQRSHLTQIPLDTIDTYLTQHEDLDPRSITDRIIWKGRGGTSSQLNIGFGMLLHGLGYLVDLVLARAAEPASDDAHVALIVVAAGRRFLVDVSRSALRRPPGARHRGRPTGHRRHLRRFVDHHR